MSAEAETKPVGHGWPEASPPAAGWNWKQLCFLIAFAFVAHLAFIFVFGEKKTPAPRVAKNFPHLQLANNTSELIALDDPTLFALPHVEDFAPAVWRRTPAITPPSFRWTEAPPFLSPAVEMLGTEFGSFMQSNQLAALSLNLKPEPEIIIPEVRAESMLPQSSSLEISGDIAQRKLLKPIIVPTLPYNDVITSSRVQLLAGDNGNVISVVSLESSGYDKADEIALQLSRTARFAPAPGLTLGEFIFNWHTVPTNTP